MRLAFLLILTSLVFYSCDLENITEKEPVYEQGDLVSQEYGGVFTKDFINFFASSAGFEDVLPFIKHSVQIYKISYQTKFKGEDITASGVIYLPEGLDSLTSVITYQHGTIFKHADAPSVSFDLFGIAVAAQGMIAFVPDYIGFGASSSLFHPYLIAESYALPVADMIRSGQEFLNKKTIQTNDNLILIGYSEGAYATLAAQKEIESNPDLNISLTAVAVGSGSYDLQLTTETVFQDSTYEYPAYSAYVMLAYDQFYGLQRPLTDFFQEPYAGKLETLFNGINDGDDINSELTMMIDDLFNPVFKNAFLDAGEQDFKLLMTENNLTNWKPLTPTFLFHGTADNLVPFANSQMAYDNFVLNGSTSVTLIPLVDRDHETALLDMVLEINNLIPRL